MPLRLNVGASKKVGEANYGSRGASVNLELELDSNLVAEPEKLREKIRQLFGLVRSSLAEELNGNGHAGSPAAKEQPPPTTGPTGPANGTAQPGGRSRSATPAQVKALYAIARQLGIDLKERLFEHCGVRRLEELTVREASQLIDTWKGTAQR